MQCTPSVSWCNYYGGGVAEEVTREERERGGESVRMIKSSTAELTADREAEFKRSECTLYHRQQKHMQETLQNNQYEKGVMEQGRGWG